MLLRKTFRFEASHILPKHPGKCSRLHGHSWVLHVEVEGDVNPETGFVQDYADISNVIKPIVEGLDHRHLGAWDKNNLPYNFNWGLADPDFPDYPSSENLLWWIAEQLRPLDTYSPLGTILTSFWSKVALEETCTSYAELSRREFDAKRQPSSVAVRTQNAP